jgi:hypothetical protein
MEHIPTPSSHLEPKEYPYCDNCDEFEDECRCDVGYQEEKSFY